VTDLDKDLRKFLLFLIEHRNDKINFTCNGEGENRYSARSIYREKRVLPLPNGLDDGRLQSTLKLMLEDGVIKGTKCLGGEFLAVRVTLQGAQMLERLNEKTLMAKIIRWLKSGVGAIFVSVVMPIVVAIITTLLIAPNTAEQDAPAIQKVAK
jgi:hypothetical protein